MMNGKKVGSKKPVMKANGKPKPVSKVMTKKAKGY